MRNGRQRKTEMEEKRQRCRKELAGRPMSTEIHQHLFLIDFLSLSPKRRGKARGFFTKMQGTNIVVTFLIPRTPSNHILGQNILTVATPELSVL